MRSRPPRVALVRARLGCQTAINHPLHFMYIAAALRSAGAARPQIIDCEPHDLDDRDVVRMLEVDPPDIIGLTAMTVDLPNVSRLAGRLRERFPDAWIWLGGSHASAEPADTLQRIPQVDVAVVGEGEQAAIELAQRWSADSRDVEGIEGAWSRDGDGAIVPGIARSPREDLDALPMPAWDLIDIEAYTHRVRRMGILYKQPRYMSLFTSRACPYKCTYCHSTFGKVHQRHGAERVLAEMAELMRTHGIHEFAFLDDIFNFDRDRLRAICEGIISRGWRVHLSFPNGIRGDLFNEELLTLLRRAGGWRLNFAPETASERIQRATKKHANLDKLHEMVEVADRLGFLCLGNFMLGFPGETIEEMRATVRWSLESRLHVASYYRVIPLAGTEISHGLTDSQGQFVGDASEHEVNATRINLSDVPAHEIDALRTEAYRAFHTNPRRVARMLRVMPKHPSLWRLYAEDVVARIGVGTTAGTFIERLGRGGAPGRRAFDWVGGHASPPESRKNPRQAG